MSRHRDEIVVVRQGDVPLVNSTLAALAADAFPDADIVDVDVLAEFRRNRRAWVTAAGPVATGLARALARRRTFDVRATVKRAVLTSAAFSRFAQGAVTRVAAPGRTRFVLQSQSLFDASIPGVPLVVYTDHVHLANLGYPAFDRSRLQPASSLAREAALYRRADLILVRSTNIADALRHGYGVDGDKVSVVGVGPNAPLPTALEPRWHGGRIVFVGYDWERKGGPQLLAAFERVRDRHPDARLDIVGVSDISARPGVTLHGRLAGAEITLLLQRSDVFCLPTLAEPFGVAFIEAMHAGLPVVGTTIGAQPDFILPGRTGELVTPDDVESLTDALERLVSDPERTMRLGAQAAELARARYTWPQVTALMRRAIDERLAGSSGAGAGPSATRSRTRTS